MAPSSVSSEEFSFPLLASLDTHPLNVDSPQLWKRTSPDTFLRGHSGEGKYGGGDGYQRKSFSYVELRTRWSDNAEEKMDMLWEDLNEEPIRSRSLRVQSDKKPPYSDNNSAASAAVNLGCGMGRSMKVTKKTTTTTVKATTTTVKATATATTVKAAATATEGKKPNVLVFMRVLKKILLLRSPGQRSPAKTHPR